MMKLVCMVCGRFLGWKPEPNDWDRQRYGAPVSHGLCSKCQRKIIDEQPKASPRG